MKRSARYAAGFLGVLAGTACGAAPSPGASADGAALHVGRLPAPDANQASDPAKIAIAVRPAPSAFRLDGDVAEWGSLAPPIAQDVPVLPPPVDPRGVDPTLEERLAAGPQAHNPADAGSFVAWALGADGVHVALDVHGPAAKGVWIGIGSEPPLVPPIGEYTRGGGFDHVICTEHVQQYSEGSRYETEALNPPEVIAATVEPARSCS